MKQMIVLEREDIRTLKSGGTLSITLGAQTVVLGYMPMRARRVPKVERKTKRGKTV